MTHIKNCPRDEDSFFRLLNLTDGFQNNLCNDGRSDIGTDEYHNTDKNDSPAALGKDIKVLANGNPRISKNRCAELQEPYVLYIVIDNVTSRKSRIGEDTT